MAYTCDDCVYKEKEEGFWGDKYECLKKKKSISPSDSACKDFIIKQKGNEYERSGCYITTIICSLLGYSDDCEVLNILRDFRENTLKKNQEYMSILYEYDQIGPQISVCLENEENPLQLARELLQGFIIPCSIAVKTGSVEEAVAIYKNMVTMLKVKYGLIGIDIDLSVDTPMEALGKGRIRTKQKSEC